MNLKGYMPYSKNLGRNQIHVCRLLDLIMFVLLTEPDQLEQVMDDN